jgi:hypothetical protein
MHTKLYFDNLNGINHLIKLCRRIILKQIFKKQEEDVLWAIEKINL